MAALWPACFFGSVLQLGWGSSGCRGGGPGSGGRRLQRGVRGCWLPSLVVWAARRRRLRFGGCASLGWWIGSEFQVYLFAGVVQRCVKWFVGDLCSVVRGPALPLGPEQRSRGSPLASHESSVFASAVWINPSYVASFLRPSGFRRIPREVVPLMCSVSLGLGHGADFHSGVSCVCRASPACSCCVFCSSKSSPVARGLAIGGMVEDWFKALFWQGVRWERRLARAKASPSWSGASDDDTHGCHSPSLRRR